MPVTERKERKGVECCSLGSLDAWVLVCPPCCAPVSRAFVCPPVNRESQSLEAMVQMQDYRCIHQGKLVSTPWS